MTGLPRALVPLAASCMLHAVSFAETPPASESAPNPIIKPSPAPRPAPARQRSVSDATAARLQEVLPKMPAPSPESAAEAARATADVEVARSPILVMPHFFVREDRVHLDDRQLLTPEGRRALELKRHPGLFLSEGRLFYSWAEEIAQDEMRAERAKEMADLFSLLPNGEKTREIKLAVPTHSNSWVDQGGSYVHRNDDRKP